MSSPGGTIYAIGAVGTSYVERDSSLASIEKRFWRNVDVCVHGSACRRCCWPWRRRKPTSPLDGMFGVAEWGTSFPAYRFSKCLERHAPLLGPQFVAMHQCNNRACVNPAHIVIGGQSDNIRYMYRCRRRRQQRPSALGVSLDVLAGMHAEELGSAPAPDAPTAPVPPPPAQRQRTRKATSVG
jgi:hypothetical protein